MNPTLERIAEAAEKGLGGNAADMRDALRVIRRLAACAPEAIYQVGDPAGRQGPHLVLDLGSGGEQSISPDGVRRWTIRRTFQFVEPRGLDVASCARDYGRLFAIWIGPPRPPWIESGEAFRQAVESGR